MELSLFTGFIFVSTRTPLLYGWTNEPNTLLQYYRPATSLNASTLVTEQRERRTQSLSMPTPSCKHCLAADPLWCPLHFHFCPTLKDPSGLALSFVLAITLWWRTPATPELQLPCKDLPGMPLILNRWHVTDMKLAGGDGNYAKRNNFKSLLPLAYLPTTQLVNTRHIFLVS